jgi:hypothetical protein
MRPQDVADVEAVYAPEGGGPGGVVKVTIFKSTLYG